MYFNKSLRFYLVILCASIKSTVANNGVRQSRTLIFPPTAPTRLQFICGIGIPVEDLHYESVTSGYVFKVEYFLPTNATEFHRTSVVPQTIHRRRSLNEYDPENMRAYEFNKLQRLERIQNDFSTYRWIIYKAMEQMAERIGLIGKACVLKSICEVARVPFHNASGILSEIAHIIMTPSSSIDVIHKHSNNEYLNAEMLGRSGIDCFQRFKECQQSLLERVSTVLNFVHH